MIPVNPAPIPPSFDSAVRDRGLRALAELVGEPPPKPRIKGRPFQKIANRREDIPPDRLPRYWTKALDDLMEAYQHICAYSCFLIHPTSGITIDRLGLNDPPFRTTRERSWSNYTNGHVSFRVLLEESPFVARELLRQGRLRPGDAPDARLER